MKSLTRLLPRFNTRYVSQSRTVLAVGLDGFADEGTEHGLFVHETRLLSRYRWLIAGQRPRPVVLSNNFNPRARYYGSATTSAFYPVAVAELWHWTDDRELVRPLVRAALDARP